MAWLGRRMQKSLGIGLFGLLMWGGAARGQEILLAIPPSQLKPGEISEGFLGFGCYNIHTLALGDCKVTLKLDPLDPAAMTGGHRNHTAPQPVGTVRDINAPAEAGEKFIERQTLNNVITVVYRAEESSGQVLATKTWTPPRSTSPTFCWDESGQWRSTCTSVRFINVRVLRLRELFATGDFAFKPRPSADLHPNAHQGAGALHLGIKVIGKTYFDATDGRRLRITDMSLPAGGLFDICGTYKADGTCPEAPKGGHVSHRTGHDVDFSKTDDADQSIDCLLQTTDAMIKAFEKANATFKKCYAEGHYHVRFQ